MSPVVQELAIELAVTGVSYRQAGQALEKLLGYPVISHEGIRQQLLNTEVLPEKPSSLYNKTFCLSKWMVSTPNGKEISAKAKKKK